MYVSFMNLVVGQRTPSHSNRINKKILLNLLVKNNLLNNFKIGSRLLQPKIN